MHPFPTGDFDAMLAERERFIKSQEHPCCPHGMELTTSYVMAEVAYPGYWFCSCCGAIETLETADEEAGQVCRICSYDSMLIPGIQDDSEVQRALLEADGWERVSIDEAYDLARQSLVSRGFEGEITDDVLMGSFGFMDTSEALYLARERGDELWRNRASEQQAAADARQRDAKTLADLADPNYGANSPFHVSEETKEQWRREASTPVNELAFLHLATLGSALGHNAWKRWTEGSHTSSFDVPDDLFDLPDDLFD